MFLCIDLGQNC